MANITGTANGESLNGTSGGDSIKGLGGADSLYGAQGDDILQGGNGDDYLVDGFSGGSDTASDVDRLEGGDGNDRIVSYQGAHFQDHDVILGGDGDDEIQLFGAQTNDSVDGGEGVDYVTVYLNNQFQSVVAHHDTTGFVVQLGGVNTVFIANSERLFIGGGLGADQVTGGSLDDLFTTGGGADTVRGLAGDDYVLMDLSNNSTHPGAVDFDGGEGEGDRLVWQGYSQDTQNHVFDLDAGIYTRGGVSLGNIVGYEELSATTGMGNDTLRGGALGELFQAGGGADLVQGKGGDDQLRGNGGNDVLEGGIGADRVEGDDGDDYLSGAGGDDLLRGGEGRDTLNGAGGNDTYSFIFTTEANDVIIDSSGLDTIQTNLAAFDMTPYGMIEQLESFAISATLTGNDLSNRMIGYSGLDAMAGGLGMDTIFGGASADSLTGGADADQLFGEDGADAIAGDAADDLLIGGAGADILAGGDGADRLYGDAPLDGTGIGMGSGVVIKGPGGGNNSIVTAIDLTNRFSTAANPEIVGASSLPHVTVRGTGGGFQDFYAVTVARPGVVLTLDIDRVGSAGVFDSTLRVFRADGTSLASNDDAPTVEGGAGSTDSNDAYMTFTAPAAGTYYIMVGDWISDPVPSGAEYRLHVTVGAAPSDDVLSGGAGVDTLDGGLGSDTASFAGAAQGVEATVSVVTNDGFGNAETLISIENLTGSGFKDRLSGNNFANRLEGGARIDSLDGKGGADTLVGGRDADKLSGSEGADTFLYLAVEDSRRDEKRDVLRDFSQAEGDVIDLSALDADTDTPELDAFDFIGTDVFSGAGAEVRYLVQDGFTIVQVDVNGGIHDMEISLNGEFILEAGDFVL